MDSLSSADSGAGLRFLRQGVERCGAATEIFCDGERISAVEGESIASTLTAHGIRKFCRSREGDERGLFCGMGVCFDCRVTVNGRPGQRACLTTVRPEMRIETESRFSVDPSYARWAPADREERCSVLIIGGGPAGLAAAEAAAQHQVDAVMLDERPYPGGQYFKPLASSHRFKNGQPFDRQYRDGLALVGRVRKLGVRICSNTLVWDAQVEGDGGIVVRALDSQGSVNWIAQKLIIATGAFERAWPVPGWTLPGVMTTGAAQTLARSYQIAPGKRVLFAGNGPLNLQVAADLAAAGVSVVGVAEAAARPGVARFADTLTMASTRPDLVWQGLGYLAKLKARGVPIHYRHVLLRVEGTDRAERAIIAKTDDAGKPIAGSEISFDIDAVCLGYGFSPSSEIGRLVGCEHIVDPRSGNALVAERQADGRTSNPNIFVAGDAGGPWGAHAAIAQGVLAGRAAATDIAGGDATAAADNTLNRQLAQEHSFQRALWRVFAAPRHLPASIDEATIICRCENVSYGAVKHAIIEGAADIPAVKRQTRCGMGRCQGRYCASIVASLLQEHTAAALSANTYSRMQTPVRPVGLHAIAAPQETAPNPGPGGLVCVARPDAEFPDVQLGQADVVVVGGGGVGLFTARELVRSGRSVIVVERRVPFAEASGANAGSLHVQFQAFGFPDLASETARRAALTLPMQVDSVYLWKQFAEETNIDIEAELEGGLTVADDAASLRHLEQKIAIERAAGLKIDLISGDDARKRLPYLSEKIIAASYSPDEGKINPMNAARAVLQSVLATGVRIDTATSVHAIERSGSEFIVRTNRGFYRAGKIVNAAGAWCGMIAAMVGDSMPVRQNPIQMIVTEPTAAKVNYHLAHARQRLTLKQAAAGNLVIGGGWRASKVDNPALARPTRAGLGGNLAVTLEILPGFGDLQMIRSWTGTAFTTQPIISQSPLTPGVFHVVTQNAMTLAPILGRTAANMVIGRKPEYDLSAFTFAPTQAQTLSA
jgi:glycine/D-amino acid oxidase-like deaminating enzyme/bacterioferritin-associated ferredoxin